MAERKLKIDIMETDYLCDLCSNGKAQIEYVDVMEYLMQMRNIKCLMY